MRSEIVIERLFEALIDGDRARALEVVREQLDAGATPTSLIETLFWPTYELADRLHRADQLTDLSFNMGTRLLRVVVDRTAARIVPEPERPGRGRTVLAACGPGEADELGAQLAVDMLEAHGFSVRFVGGGVATDEIQSYVQLNRPDVLVLFCSAPADLPGIRKLIDDLRTVAACPDTQIVLGGGVFNRAEGLAEEIGADLWAEHPLELAELIASEPNCRADLSRRTVGKTRKLRNAA